MTKQTMFPFFASDEWVSVDDTDDPGLFVKFLDQMAATLRDSRLELIRLLELSRVVRCSMRVVVPASS